MMRLACNCSRNVWTSVRILSLGARMNWASSFCTISATEKCPSQSSRMTRPVPSTRIAPSGKRTTGASAVPPQRHPAANFGTLASLSSATVLLNSKRSRRRPTRFDIREVECIELRPQNVALVAQCLDDAILLGACSGVVVHILDGKGSVFRRLRQPRLKVIERGSEPGIVLAHLLHAQRDQVAGKKFGQRRSDAFQKRTRPHQVEIFVSDKTRSRENLIGTHHPLVIKPGRFRQLDPT